MKGDETIATLTELLDRRALRRLAGAQSFERGEYYAADGRVTSVVEETGTLTAKVQGARPYRVSLWVDGGQMEYSCTCPVGHDGAFCKHCVAVGLTWLHGGQSTQRATPKGGSKPTVTMHDVRDYLAHQDKSALVDLIAQHAANDDRLCQQLIMRAAKMGAKRLDVSSYRRALDLAMDTGGFVEYGAAHDYAQGIEDVVDSLDELLREGYGVEVIELAEHALAGAEVGVESVDDSDGYMGGVLERLQALHLKACKKARPDPQELAMRLVEWELRTDGDVFYGASATYAGVLGAKGLAVYRERVEAEWAKVPILRPGSRETQGYARRHRITHMMETLAQQTGDIEAVVEVKKRDLSLAYSYLQIAETYRAARKHDLALEWAEHGLKAFPVRTDSRLREFLAQEYHRRKRHDDAMTLIWTEFAESPTLDRFRVLKKHATSIKRWKEWRPKAIELLRQSIGKTVNETGSRQFGWSRRTDHSEVVRILLWEKKIDDAWREAVEGGCTEDLWTAAATARRKAHPDDSLPVYQRRIDPTLGRKNNAAYREAIGLLREIRALMVLAGRAGDFAPYAASVRATHKAKRNFVKLLDHARWT